MILFKEYCVENNKFVIKINTKDVAAGMDSSLSINVQFNIPDLNKQSRYSRLIHRALVSVLDLPKLLINECTLPLPDELSANVESTQQVQLLKMISLCIDITILQSTNFNIWNIVYSRLVELLHDLSKTEPTIKLKTTSSELIHLKITPSYGVGSMPEVYVVKDNTYVYAMVKLCDKIVEENDMLNAVKEVLSK